MKNDLTYLSDVLEMIDNILGRLNGITYEDFLSNENLQDSMLLKIIHIGEALNRVSEDFQRTHPELPWSQAIGMRHRLAHDYETTDMREVWLVAERDLPRLREIVASLEAAS